MIFRWVCLTHSLHFPHSVHRQSPDSRKLPAGTARIPCRPVSALVVAASILEA